MSLLDFENAELVIKPEALAIKAFKTVWDNDKTVDKYKAIQLLSYIYFMYDPRSDYMYLTDDEDRHTKITEDLGFRKNWKITKDMQKAIEVYQQNIQTTSSQILETSRKIVDRMNKYLLEVDFDEVGIDKVSNVTNRLPDIIEKLQKAEKLVVQELEENEKLRGDKHKKLCEDGFNF